MRKITNRQILFCGRKIYLNLLERYNYDYENIMFTLVYVEIRPQWSIFSMIAKFEMR